MTERSTMVYSVLCNRVQLDDSIRNMIILLQGVNLLALLISMDMEG